MTPKAALLAWRFRREIAAALKAVTVVAVGLALLVGVALAAVLGGGALVVTPLLPETLVETYRAAAAEIPDPGIDWRWLPAIHAVQLQQDFSLVDQEAIVALAGQFVDSVMERRNFDWAPCPPGVLPPPDARAPHLPDDGVTYCPKVEYVLVIRVRTADEVMQEVVEFSDDEVRWAEVMYRSLTERFP